MGELMEKRKKILGTSESRETERNKRERGYY